MSTQTKRRLGLGLFVAGIFLGVLVAGMTTWANTEAMYYGFPRMTLNRLSSLRCPHFMAWDETSSVRVNLKNTNAYPSTVGIKSWVSVPLAWEIQTDHRRLAPGEVWRWQRPIGPDNRELRHFIFVSVYAFGGYPMPERQSICGVYVLPVRGVHGEALMWLVVVLGMALLFAGWWLWRRAGGEADAPSVVRWVVHFFLVLVPVTLATALWLSWVVAVALLVMDVLMAVIVGLSVLMRTS